MILTDLQKLTKPYADARGQLAEVVSELNRDIEALKRKKLPVIRELVARAAAREGSLRSGIDGNRELFIEPRTVIFHGVKIGLQKGKGGIEIPDEDRTLDLIRKHFPDDEAPAYIHIAETPDKKMLAGLPAGELKQLGCNVINTGDEIVIRPTDTEVDKQVNALIKAATGPEA